MIQYLGDTAISVRLSNEIAPDLINRVHGIDFALGELGIEGIVETIPTYNGITIFLDPVRAKLIEIEAALIRLVNDENFEAPIGKFWEVPIAYGGRFGPDLGEVAKYASINALDVKKLHLSRVYTVAMLGFLPGFSYLLGLNPKISMPRRATPRTKISSSSISIGGQQTAIGSVEGPSGWHIIGRTPVRPFQLGRSCEFLFRPGDRIKFREITQDEWFELDDQASRGNMVAEVLET